MVRWIKIVRKRVSKANIDERSPSQLHVLSVEEVVAAEVVVIKGYQKMELKAEFMVLDDRRSKKLKKNIGGLNL